MSGSVIWADALQALTLFAADPVRLGGISVRAGAGPVRDRFLQLLKEAFPGEIPIRRLPLNTGDDRLLGGLDLAATLQSGRPIAQKGLLAEANGGILVLAMAERIEPGTAAKVRAAMDERSIILQRDGLSGVLETEFGVVALDEGSDADERLPASLLDRLAFHLDLTGVAIGDVAAWHDVRPALCPGLSSKLVLDPIATPIPGDNGQAIEVLCQTALALGIESLRAVLLALRTAQGAAKLSNHSNIDLDDLALAARLVLAPRATRLPAARDPVEEEAEPEQPPEDPGTEQDEKTLPDKPIEDLVLDAAQAALPPNLLAQLALLENAKGQARALGRAGQIKISLKRGRPIGTRQGDPKNGARLHLLDTLKAAAPWQNLRHPTGRFQVRRDDFRIVRFRQRIGTTTIFAVDASGSAALNRLAEAKGAVELLLADCYVRRDQVALIAFRGNAASILLPPTGSLLRAKRSLAGLPGGGPTPLAAGIEAALRLADGIRRAGRTPVITFLTDARANMTRDGSGGRPRAEAEALEVARMLRGTGVASLLVDTSPRPNPFARQLAEEMRAQYLPLPYADASSLSKAVRTAVP